MNASDDKYGYFPSIPGKKISWKLQRGATCVSTVYCGLLIAVESAFIGQSMTDLFSSCEIDHSEFDKGIRFELA
jgi:hypothetical protein